jgi:hypothetical protein
MFGHQIMIKLSIVFSEDTKGGVGPAIQNESRNITPLERKVFAEQANNIQKLLDDAVKSLLKQSQPPAKNR